MSRTLHHSKFNDHFTRGRRKAHAMKRKYLRSFKLEEMYIELPVYKKAPVKMKRLTTS